MSEEAIRVADFETWVQARKEHQRQVDQLSTKIHRDAHRYLETRLAPVFEQYPNLVISWRQTQEYDDQNYYDSVSEFVIVLRREGHTVEEAIDGQWYDGFEDPDIDPISMKIIQDTLDCLTFDDKIAIWCNDTTINITKEGLTTNG